MRTLQGFSTALWASPLDPAAQTLIAAVSACERWLVLRGPRKMNLGWAAMWTLLSGLVGPGDGPSMPCPLKWWRLGCVKGNCSLQEEPLVGWTACCPTLSSPAGNLSGQWQEEWKQNQPLPPMGCTWPAPLLSGQTSPAGLLTKAPL